MKKEDSKKKKDPEHFNIYGYGSVDEVASEIAGSIHCTLLSGAFVFAYRGTGDLKRLVVTRTGDDTWMYGIVTTGWTGLVPKASKAELIDLVLPELVSKKTDKRVIEDFKYYIEL